MSHDGLRKDVEDKYVARNIQTCGLCKKNFSSDRAASRHYKREKPHGERCQEPETVGLVPFQNKYGATIWREKRRAVGPDR